MVQEVLYRQKQYVNKNCLKFRPLINRINSEGMMRVTSTKTCEAQETIFKGKICMSSHFYDFSADIHTQKVAKSFLKFDSSVQIGCCTNFHFGATVILFSLVTSQ